MTGSTKEVHHMYGRGHKEAHSVLEKAADDMTHFYDVHRQAAPVYKVGDKVWLNAQNISTT